MDQRRTRQWWPASCQPTVATARCRASQSAANSFRRLQARPSRAAGTGIAASLALRCTPSVVATSAGSITTTSPACTPALRYASARRYGAQCLLSRPKVMAKNAQNTWVGTQVQPAFRTYQTAGQMQAGGGGSPPPPTTAPPPATPPPVITPPPVFTPPPVVTPTPPSGGIGGPVYDIPVGNVPGNGEGYTPVPDSRASLVNAIIAATSPSTPPAAGSPISRGSGRAATRLF